MPLKPYLHLVAAALACMLTQCRSTRLYVSPQGVCSSPYGTNKQSSNATQCTLRIYQAIQYCKSSEACEGVQLNNGSTYPVVCNRPNEAAIYLNGTIGLWFGSLDYNNPSTLLVQYGADLCRGVVAYDALNLTLMNVILDTFRPPFTLLEAVSVEDAPGHYQNATFTFSNSLDASMSGLSSGSQPWLEHVDTLFPFSYDEDRVIDPANPAWGGGHCSFSAPSPQSDLPGSAYQPLQLVSMSNRTVKMPCNGTDPPKPGALFVARHYSNHGAVVWCIRCANLTLSSVVVHTGAGMGLRCDLCNGTTVIESGSGVRRRQERMRDSSQGQHSPTTAPGPGAGPGAANGRLAMSATADGLHFMSTRGDIQAHYLYVEGQGDDCMNVHGNYITILPLGARGGSYHWWRRADLVDERAPGWLPYRNDKGAGWLSDLPSKLIGDEVSFVRGDTLQSFNHASSLLAARGKQRDPTDRWATSKAESPLSKPATSRILAANSTHLLLADALPLGFEPGRDAIISIDAQPSTVAVIESVFNRTKSKGLMLSGGRSIIVQNNLFELVPHANVLLGSGTSLGYSYTEGPPARGLRVGNNVFVGGAQGGGGTDGLGVVQLSACGQQSYSQRSCVYLRELPPVGYFADVAISNNTFHRLTYVQPFVYAGLVDGLLIERNLVLYQGGAKPPTGQGDGCLYGNVEGSVVARGNECEFFDGVCAGLSGTPRSYRNCRFECAPAL